MRKRVCELFPLLLTPGLKSEMKRFREFIVWNPDNTYSIFHRGTEEDGGEIDYWEIKSNTGYLDIRDLCKAILVNPKLLIYLN